MPLIDDRRPDEERPLLGGARKPHSLASQWRKYLVVDVNRDWADVVLILCYFITGLLDSSSISVWGSFVSMQTGNTVYIGLGLAHPHESTRWIKSGTSLASFCAGSFIFSRFHRFFSPKRRWVLCASFFLQLLLTVGAASIVTKSGTPKDKEDIGWDVLLPIAMVAFQSCGQAVTSRALKYNALTSVVLTSIYCDLFSDAELFYAKNAERNRRVGAPAFLLLGALVGGRLSAHPTLGVAVSLWTAAALKAVVVIVWLVWPADPASVEED
ncbi:DUF1275 domain protein [Podospora aff. communis PSN243]|uniref:DUF1275 domain protein n=1 Tax=Podospora aff. communis PSN243 TaxID=3040156 RepID=A0AAV9H3G1_9PEZI|nr:DUF1275 domain protein [Podospora aff. communis PSN243]